MPAEIVFGADWDDPEADLLAFDRLIHAHEGGPIALRLHVERPEEVILRYQRLWPWRNEASRSSAFALFEVRHRDLHDITLPLVRADLDHARDVWQWVLRLDPRASLALQLAALLHDVERLESEALTRIEQHAPDYQAFKDAHAARGAQLAVSALDDLFEPPTVERVAELVARHERPGDDPELALLNDADALSFFALNSPGYLAWFGPEQTARKVAYTLDRLGPTARPWLDRVRLPAQVRAIITAEP